MGLGLVLAALCAGAPPPPAAAPTDAPTVRTSSIAAPGGPRIEAFPAGAPTHPPGTHPAGGPTVPPTHPPGTHPAETVDRSPPTHPATHANHPSTDPATQPGTETSPTALDALDVLPLSLEDLALIEALDGGGPEPPPRGPVIPRAAHQDRLGRSAAEALDGLPGPIQLRRPQPGLDLPWLRGWTGWRLDPRLDGLSLAHPRTRVGGDDTASLLDPWVLDGLRAEGDRLRTSGPELPAVEGWASRARARLRTADRGLGGDAALAARFGPGALALRASVADLGPTRVPGGGADLATEQLRTSASGRGRVQLGGLELGAGVDHAAMRGFARPDLGTDRQERRQLDRQSLRLGLGDGGRRLGLDLARLAYQRAPDDGRAAERAEVWLARLDAEARLGAHWRLGLDGELRLGRGAPEGAGADTDSGRHVEGRLRLDGGLGPVELRLSGGLAEVAAGHDAASGRRSTGALGPVGEARLVVRHSGLRLHLLAAHALRAPSAADLEAAGRDLPAERSTTGELGAAWRGDWLDLGLVGWGAWIPEALASDPTAPPGEAAWLGLELELGLRPARGLELRAVGTWTEAVGLDDHPGPGARVHLRWAGAGDGPWIEGSARILAPTPLESGSTTARLALRAGLPLGAGFGVELVVDDLLDTSTARDPRAVPEPGVDLRLALVHAADG